MRTRRAREAGGARGTVRALLTAALLTGALATPGATQGFEDEDGTQPTGPFALPLARDARTLAEEVSQHLAAERWNEGLARLQQLIDEHRADVLPDDWRRSADEPSLYSAFPGAAAWATERLFELPAEVRALYVERNEVTARAGLERARRRNDRRGLIEIARRWPICPAAADAWWALGDLELERGAGPDALIAYGRAKRVDELSARGTDPERAGRAARIELARSLEVDDDGRPSPFLASGGRATRQGLPRGPVPRGDADSWPEPFLLDVTPLQPSGSLDAYSLFPVQAEGRILVNSGYRVTAVDAYTGTGIWQSAPPYGWSELRGQQQGDLAEAIAHEDLLLEPAVGGGVVVAAMQIPYSDNPSDRWQGIDIMEAIPERRLYAFDVESGEELWNHAPELTWNLHEARFTWNQAAGTYAERMLVAAPPVIVGSRVLVPCYRMSGRIEYHVACYALETGERMWSTALISGQRETNMFGRAGKEFVASPVAVAGDRVIAQTELGTVAALDLVTGNILWESLYEQEALPKTLSYNPPKRRSYWRVAPPVVEDGVVVSTPSDSRFLIGFLLEDGRVPWSFKQRELSATSEPKRLQLDCLLGAVDDTVYLGGEKIAAFQRPGGLASRGPFLVRWSVDLEAEHTPLSRPRALLCESEVVVPLRDQRLVLDRLTGETVHPLSGPWSFHDFGNVFVGSGALFTLNRQQLNGYFDWETLILRQRALLAESNGDALVASATAELLARRAHAVREGGDAARSLALLREARELLEPLAGDHAGARDVERLVYETWRGEAEALIDLADSTRALAALGEARELAPHPRAACETLLEEERILRSRSLDRRLEVLAELEQRCPDQPLSARDRGGPSAWLIGESFLRPDDLEGLEKIEVPVRLWVLLARADALARARRTAESLEDLHDALARYGDFGLVDGLTVADVVEERIARRLELDGRGEYLTFEVRARELFKQAAVAGDPGLFAEVGRRYPHSEAARDARQARLAWAYTTGDASAVARTAYPAFSNAPLPTEADARVLLRLATTLGAEGNPAFERTALVALARTHPDLRSDLPEHDGKTLAALAETLLASAPPRRLPPPTFDPEIRSTGVVGGRHTFVGQLAPSYFAQEEAPRTAHVYLRSDDSLRVFASDAPSQFLWPPYELPFGARAERIAVADTRIVAGGSDDGQHLLIALDERGEVAWQHTLERRIVTVTGHGGLVLVFVGTSSSPDQLLAFDAHAGIPLWDMTLPRYPGNWIWHPPIVSGDVAVLFARQWNHPSRAVAIDLYRGRIRSELELDEFVHNSIEEGAWIDAKGRLMVPAFVATANAPSGLTAYDIETGQRVWRIGFPTGEELHAIAASEGRDYLITLGASIDRRGRGGAIYELDADLGDVRTVLELKTGDEPMGFRREERIELPSPFLFLHTRGGSSHTTPIRAIQLPGETRWVYSLPVSPKDIYDSGMPMPVVSAEYVALAYVAEESGRPAGVRLIFADRDSGLPVDRRDLDFGPVEGLELHGLGSALFVVGRGRGTSSDQIEILEDIR